MSCDATKHGEGRSRQEQTTANYLPFVPPEPSADDPRVRERWLLCLTPPGAPVIDVDGMSVPLLDPGAAELAAVWEATSLAVEQESGDRARQQVCGQRPRRQPRRNVRLRMEAAYLHQIEGQSSVEVAKYLGLGGEPDVVSRNMDGPDRERHRGAEKIIAAGDRAWADLGAWWPWADADRDWAGELAAWHACAVRDARVRVGHDQQAIRRSLRAVKG